MKTIISFPAVILLCLSVSCNRPGTESDTTAANSTTNTSNDEIKRMTSTNDRVYKAIETGNFNGIDTLMADDIVDHTTPTGTEIKGKDSVIAMLKRIGATYKDLKFDTKASSYDADKGMIFSLVRMTGTTAVAMNGMPVNTPIDMTSVDVVKVKNGKATDHWGFEDPAETIKMMSKQPGEKH